MIIQASAPTRIDLAGGTVDIWPLYLFHPGAKTLNLAISLTANCKLIPREDNIVSIESKDTNTFVETTLDKLSTTSELELLVKIVDFFKPQTGLTLITECSAPAGSGLGGSSTLDIAVCGALNHFTKRNCSKTEILTIAKNLETQVIRVPAGDQDYYPAMYGGANVMHLNVEGIKREALEVDLAKLEDHLVLCYTGKPHFSGTNNWEITKNHIDGNKTIFALFDRIRDITSEMRKALISNNLTEVANLLNQEWETRKELAPGVSTPKIEELIGEAKSKGALAAKVCGAGGGGCVTFLTPPDKKLEVSQAISQAGGQVLDFHLVKQGLQIKEIA
ncbi:MAG: GHMP kinase [Acidobacteria bacterium]|nr:GHMP kinase [Acidobacteriota bacterium]